MAHFAKIGLNSKVIQVIHLNNSVLLDANNNESEQIGIEYLMDQTKWPIWKQTSYNGNIRKNFAGVGYTYDEDRDAFIPPKPYSSWILNETTCQWKAPVDKPEDGEKYNWNEETTAWEIISG